MKFDLMITVFSTIITLISLFIAIYQTAKLRKVEQIRNADLMHLWRELKKLSGDLYGDKNIDLREYGKKSQCIERLIAKFIVSVCGLNRNHVDNLHSEGEIDNFDYETMRFCTWEPKTTRSKDH